MTPNHPSNKKHRGILKNHVAFAFLENGCFRILEKDELFEQLITRAETVLQEKRAQAAKLRAVCKLLADNVSYYDWVGFYVVDKEQADQLVLGPFVGEPTEHVRIPFGRGICGQAASRKETFIVQDVTKESNYLSCSSKVKSEIVIPVFRDGKLVGELDIDSHIVSPFTSSDKTFLSKIGEMTSGLL